MKPKKWKCDVCGYVHDGDSPPDRCPKCSAPAEKFTELDEQAATLVERSRRTNALHCRMVSLAREIEAVCKDGMDDKLDPGCVKVFERCLECSYEMMKLSMTEMAGHIAKGKWS